MILSHDLTPHSKQANKGLLFHGAEDWVDLRCINCYGGVINRGRIIFRRTCTEGENTYMQGWVFLVGSQCASETESSILKS